MATITCAISGIRFECSHLSSINVPHTAGYFHPVFASDINSLYSLYSKYSHNQLNPTDSYLLFLAFLNHSTKLEWSTPVALNPNHDATKALIANYIAQLITVIEQTNLIRHPNFHQPSFRVTLGNSSLHQIPDWIECWQENITSFYSGIRDDELMHDFHKLEAKLTSLIKSEQDESSYPDVVAQWANLAAEFPNHKEEKWIAIISACFNPLTMIAIPLEDIKACKDYCEENIISGSIHSFTLYKVLNEGIKNHIDYLGYVLTPTDHNPDDEVAGDTELEDIINNAPTSKPIRRNYVTKLEYIIANLAYSAAMNTLAETDQL